MQAQEDASLRALVNIPEGRTTIPSLPFYSDPFYSDRPARHLLCCALQVGMGVSCGASVVVKPVETVAARAVATMKAAVVAVVSQRKAVMVLSSLAWALAVCVEGKGRTVGESHFDIVQARGRAGASSGRK